MLRWTTTCLLAMLAALLLCAPAQAAPRRVVALEWDGVENLLALGVKPVGAADLRGMRNYVSIGVPGAIADVGTRQEPSIERIARLKPDLVVVPDFRSGRNLKTLRRISKVLVTHPYPGDTSSGAGFRAMVSDFRAIGRAVGRSSRAEGVLRGLSSTFSGLRRSLAHAHRSGIRVTVATPGGTSGSPAARLFTDNSAAAEIVRRLGMRNAWTAAPARYGYSTVGVEALRKVQSGWLMFIQAAPRTEISRFTSQAAYRRLDMVRRKRVRTLRGNTWLFGGPSSATAFAQRMAAALS